MLVGYVMKVRFVNVDMDGLSVWSLLSLVSLIIRCDVAVVYEMSE